jgi:hypothetical protein
MSNESTKNQSASDRRMLSRERRGNEVITQFPIITKQGICVRRDRRKIPDRRMSQIVVRQATLRTEVFNVLFSKFVASENDALTLRSLKNKKAT